MKNLSALVSHPLITTSGVVTRPGYHESTEAYADFPDELMVDFPLDPTRGELVAALKQIWRPFSEFKFATADDRGAMLAAVIGAVGRPGITLAPGVLFDAPCPGSGKTLCAQAVGSIVLGRRAPVTPYSGVNDEELKKQMVATSLGGFDWFLLDNVDGYYDSAVMASVLTSGHLRDRVLGVSLMFDGQVKMNIAMTSNNAALSRDLTSRFIRVRIDTGAERPQSLSFSFDPVERALTERLAILRAVCVVVQGFFAAGSPRIGKGDARFPEWSRVVRQCVLWCGQNTPRGDRVSDTFFGDSGTYICEFGGEYTYKDGCNCGLDCEWEHGFRNPWALDDEDDEYDLPSLAEEAGIGKLGDPAHQIIEGAGRSDPESRDLGLLLHGLLDVFGGGGCFFSAREVLAVVDGHYGEAAEMVKEGIEGLRPKGSRGPLNSKGVSNLLGYRVDRICDGLVLRKYEGAKKTSSYGVSKV